MNSYYVRTVGAGIPLVGERTMKAESAQALVDQLAGTGNYRRVDVAPAVPVNGYPEGLTVKRGDVAWWAAS